MKILILAPSLPYPPTDGGKIRVLNLLRVAAQTFDVTLLALETEKTDREAAEALRADGIHTTLVPQRPVRVPPLTLRAGLRGVLRGWPLAVSKYYLPDFAAAVERQLRERHFDLVHVEMLHLAPYLPLVRRLSDAPVLLSTQNVDSDVWGRAAPHQPTRWGRWGFRWQARVFARAESRIGAQFDGVTAASARDRALYERILPGVPIEVVDNGVDLSAYRPRPEREEPATFVYTGSYDWLPNADAVTYFCGEVWPIIRAAIPEARFIAVGKNPTPTLRALDGKDGIEVTGRVPEIQPYIERATVYVVPLRIGGGTRLKILEAMAMGKAIVSTSIGSEGLDLVTGRDLVVADTASEFARAALDLARDSARRRQLGIAARQRVEERYGWESIGARMNAFYERLVKTGRHIDADRQPDGSR